MQRFSQQRYIAYGPGGRPPGPGGLLGRIVAFIVGLGVLAISFFVGAIFLAAIVGFVLIVGLVVMVRVWWLRRKMERYAREHGDLEGEYTVIRTEDERRRRR